MTTPTERTRALIYAGELLAKLSNGELLEDHNEIQRQALIVLRHYPDAEKINEIAEVVATHYSLPLMDVWHDK